MPVPDATTGQLPLSDCIGCVDSILLSGRILSYPEEAREIQAGLKEYDAVLYE